MHSGDDLKMTLTRIRDTYWIPRGREAVKRFIKRCVVCQRHGGKTFPHLAPPNLPNYRVDNALPWTNTGVDYGGPLYVLNRSNPSEKTTEKVYISLFTCALTRVIHLELVKNCSAEQFLLAFRRFTGRRGLPHMLISDNAKNLKRQQRKFIVLGDRQRYKTIWQMMEYIGNSSWKRPHGGVGFGNDSYELRRTVSNEQ